MYQSTLSVIVVSFNSATFLRSTLDTIGIQSMRDYECLVIDGGSMDDTLELLLDYPWVSILSEPDAGYHDAFLKGLEMAQGEFITQCCVSDGYLSTTWFEDAVALLRNNPDCDLAWGFPQHMSEAGQLGAVAFSELRGRKDINRQRMYFHYLAFGFHLPEINYVVRASALRECFRREPGVRNSDLEFESWLEFENNFHHSGRLTIGHPGVVSFGRSHGGSITRSQFEANERHLKRFHKRRQEHIRTRLQDPVLSRQGFAFRYGLIDALVRGWSRRLEQGVKSRMRLAKQAKRRGTQRSQAGGA